MSDLITVRYFAGAAAAAGTEVEVVDGPAGCTLDELADRLAARHGPDLARVLAVASFLIDEVTGPRRRLVPRGSTVDVLPPFAGG